MRIITDTGADNVGINPDPANLIMYGKGNPVDALDLFRGYINGVHVRDGDYPVSFYSLAQSGLRERAVLIIPFTFRIALNKNIHNTNAPVIY